MNKIMKKLIVMFMSVAILSGDLACNAWANEINDDNIANPTEQAEIGETVNPAKGTETGKTANPAEQARIGEIANLTENSQDEGNANPAKELSNDDILLGEPNQNTEITVEFVNEKGSNDTEPRVVNVGGTYGSNDSPLPYPTAGEFYFKGWFTRPDGNLNDIGEQITQDTAVDASKSYVSADNKVTLYAHWTRKVTTGRIVGTSLALSGYVELNYYLSLPENVALNDRSYVEIRNSVDGNSAKYLVKDCIYGVEDGMDIYKFSYRLNVKNMTDKLELRVYTGDGTLQPLVNSYGYAISGNAFGYSVSDYINAVANSDTQSADMTRLKSLCASLNTYGDFARVYFGYNASGLNTSDESISGYDKDTVGHEKVVTGTLPAGLEYMGSSLLLNSGTAIRHYFSVDTGHAISEYTFKIDGNVVANDAIKYKDTVYYIEIPGMSAQYLGYAHVLNINNGAYTITTVHYPTYTHALIRVQMRRLSIHVKHSMAII